MLPSEDRECLEARQLEFSEVVERRMTCVVLHRFPLPKGAAS